MFQTSSYVSLKYVYYRIPFSWANWLVLFPLAAFSTAVVTYHNVDEQRSILNATHLDTFVIDNLKLLAFRMANPTVAHPPASAGINENAGVWPLFCPCDASLQS